MVGDPRRNETEPPPRQNRATPTVLPIGGIGADLPNLFHRLIRFAQTHQGNEIPTNCPSRREPHADGTECAGVFVGAAGPTHKNDSGDYCECKLDHADDSLAQVVGLGVRFGDGICCAKPRRRPCNSEISRNVDTTPATSTTIVIQRRALRRFVSAVGSRKPATLDAAEPTGTLLDDASIVMSVPVTASVCAPS
jgi:hypothetical protein